jgi:hypothetical protein
VELEFMQQATQREEQAWEADDKGMALLCLENEKNFMIENMINWHHSGFNVYCGNAIWPHNEEGLENLARYIIEPPFLKSV